MKIAAVVITCNRLPLLPRALKSIAKQNRKPDFVFVVSNSTDDNFCKEQEICSQFGFNLYRNNRTENYAGALNTAIEEIVKLQGISDDIFFASLNEDDIWLPDYLEDIEKDVAVSSASCFLKLTTLLKAGAFNEGLSKTIEIENQINRTENNEFLIFTNEISFENKGNYQFVIGFIAGNDVIAKRVSKQIVQKTL